MGVAAAPQRRAFAELAGICARLPVDSYLDEADMAALAAWLTARRWARLGWAGSVIATRVGSILEQGMLLREQADDLRATLAALSIRGLPRQRQTRRPGTVQFRGRRFCFTGRLVSGTRRHCEALTVSCGALILKSVGPQLDYLVVGALSGGGRGNGAAGKLAQAERARREGQPLVILGERAWHAALASAMEARAFQLATAPQLRAGPQGDSSSHCVNRSAGSGRPMP